MVAPLPLMGRYCLMKDGWALLPDGRESTTLPPMVLSSSVTNLLNAHNIIAGFDPFLSDVLTHVRRFWHPFVWCRDLLPSYPFMLPRNLSHGRSHCLGGHVQPRI